jgi:hypothetical protein
MTLKDAIVSTKTSSSEEKATAIAQALLDAGVTEPKPGALKTTLHFIFEKATPSTPGGPLLDEIHEIVSRRQHRHVNADDSDLTVFLKLVAKSPLFNAVDDRNSAYVMGQDLKAWLGKMK